MGNSYFRFKQFIVNQDNCGMKVTTDACLFGAWVANWLKKNSTTIQNALDIGTGTGLLTLMVAQQNEDLLIDAVEIEELSALQAGNNCKSSPFNNRINVFNTDIKLFKIDEQALYNFIFCNPPFFENDLKSIAMNRNLAMHNASLNLEELLNNIARLLTNEGYFALLLPYNRFNYFNNLAHNKGYYLIEKVEVKQTPTHNYFRLMLCYSKKPLPNYTHNIVIKKDIEYSDAFITLLKDYYLNL